MNAMLLLLLLLCPANAAAAEMAPPPPPPEKSVDARLWDSLYTARVHVRYHQGMARWFACVSFWGTVGGIGLAIVSLTAPWLLGNRKVWKNVATIIGAVSLLAALWLTVSGISDDARTHEIVARDWLTLERRIEALDAKRHTLPEAELLAEWDRLRAEQESIERAEPTRTYDESYLRTCQRAENHHLGIDG